MARLLAEGSLQMERQAAEKEELAELVVAVALPEEGELEAALAAPAEVPQAL